MREAPPCRHLPPLLTQLQALGSHVGPDKERLRLFNKLCKMCSRQRLLPTSMHIPDSSWESIGDDCYGGQATVSQCTYKGRRVAVKIPYLYLTSDFDGILGVSISPTHVFHRFERINYRDSAEKRLLGNTSSIQTSCRYLVYHWPNGDSRWFRNGWTTETSTTSFRKTST